MLYTALLYLATLVKFQAKTLNQLQSLTIPEY